MTRRQLLGLVTLMSVFGFDARGQDGSGNLRSDNKLLTASHNIGSKPAVDAPVKPATDDPNYVIGPQDELNVNIWHEPDISRTVPVRPDGKISLPLLNDVQATGLTPMQLSAAISEKLNKFISEPQVTVIVTGINSQRIFLVGEVLRTGAQTLLPNMTALEAISNAGGFTPFAKKTKIYILRHENGKDITIRFNYKEAVTGRRPEQDVRLMPGDKIVVP
jgi:polysaccharide export outer membrane protein